MRLITRRDRRLIDQMPASERHWRVATFPTTMFRFHALRVLLIAFGCSAAPLA
jgi:hypothetical protein